MQRVILSHISYWYSVPSIAQLVERRTVVEELKAEILRSLVRIRFEGSILPNYFNLNRFVNVHYMTYIFQMIIVRFRKIYFFLGYNSYDKKQNNHYTMLPHNDMLYQVEYFKTEYHRNFIFGMTYNSCLFELLLHI